MSFSFLGMDPPVAGEYDVVSALPTVGSEVGVYLTLSATDMFNPFYSSSPQGKVYIDVSGSTITATACSVKMINMSTNDTTVLDGKMIKP
jgi:hypothetical protein